jgi:hypothetical protein
MMELYIHCPITSSWRGTVVNYLSTGTTLPRSINRRTARWTTGHRFPVEARIFFLRYDVQTGSGALSASSPTGTRTLSAGLKRLEREAHMRIMPRNTT